MVGYSGDRGQECGQETEKRTFQWERNQSGKWERKCILDREGKNTGNRSRDMGAHQEDYRDHQQLHGHDSCEDISSTVYEEYHESSHDLSKVKTQRAFMTLCPQPDQPTKDTRQTPQASICILLNSCPLSGHGTYRQGSGGDRRRIAEDSAPAMRQARGTN